MHTDDEKYEGYIKTITGREFYLVGGRPEDIDIKDVAHALYNVSRFSGHTLRRYSVAEHSILVHNILRSWGVTHGKTLLTGLLHDATEAYLPDMPTPFKAHMPEFRRYEAELWTRIADRFGLYEYADDVPVLGIKLVLSGSADPDVLNRSLIKHADRMALFIEATLLQPHGDCENWPEFEFYGMLARGWINENRDLSLPYVEGSRIPELRDIKKRFLRIYNILVERIALQNKMVDNTTLTKP